MMGSERSPETVGLNRVGLNRVELIDEVARVVEIPKQQADDIVEAILGSIVRALERSERIEIRGFGSFGTRQRGARTARNPKTGARVEVPARKIPFFKASKEVGELLKKLHAAGETKTPPV